MGIKDLMPFLKKNGFLERKIPFDLIQGKGVAIDMDNLIVRFYSIAKNTILDNTNLQVDMPEEKSVVEETCDRVNGHLRSLSNICTLYLCFDGKASDLKVKAWKERKKPRDASQKGIEGFESISPFDRTDEDIKRFIKHYRSSYNRRTVQAILESTKDHWKERATCIIGSGDNQEAEAECVKLIKAGKCHLVYSRDTDLIAYGATNIVRDISWRDRTVSIVKKSDVLRSLGLNMKQLRDFCIMCGTDYNPRIKGIGPVRSLALIKKYGSIDNMDIDTTVLNHKEVRALFIV